METVKLGLLIKKTKVARCGEHSYPVLSITKQDGIIMQSEKFKKRIASADTSDYKIIPRGKLVQGIHIDEGNFGIQDIVDNGIVSPAYGVWDINDGLVIPKYLEMVLRSPKSIEFYRSKLTGTVNRRGHMSDADFLSMDIPLPDRDTQSKILKTMKQTTSVLYSRQQQLAKLDELIKARFVEMFGDPVTNPFNWPAVELGQRCEIITGNTPSRAEPENYGTFIEWIKSDNINTPSTFLTPAQEYLSEVGFRKCRFVESGSLLMTCIAGSLNCIGNVAVTNRRVAFNQQINAITPTCDNVLYLYWLMILSKPAIHKTINMALKGILSKSQLSSIKFPFPSIECQNQFADFVAEVDKSKVEVQKALDQTQLLFDSLMQQYFG